MPSRRPRTPKYRHYKPKNLAVVRIDGKDHYLGRYGSPESHEKYSRLLAEWFSSKTTSVARKQHASGNPPLSESCISVNELTLSYWMHAKSYYVKHGRPTDEQAGIRSALRFVRRLYGTTPAREFGPLALKAVRQAMIEADISRGVINQYVGRVRRMFRWGVENELIPVEVYQALLTVKGLGKGRSNARETEPVKPVPHEHVEATLPHLTPVVRSMVLFQRLTGCRPQDVCLVRPCDIHTESDPWCYTPPIHKTEHNGYQRKIYIGPQAQVVLRPWLGRAPDAYCFSPKESAAMSLAKRGRTETPRSSSQRFTREPDRKRTPGDRYTRFSYKQAIHRACKRAGVPAWNPNQLRHACGTEVRQRYGLEAARLILGHRSTSTTEIYAEKDLAEAIRIMKEMG